MIEADSIISQNDMYIIVETCRNQNIGTTLRCAVAFGATAVIIVGSHSKP